MKFQGYLYPLDDQGNKKMFYLEDGYKYRFIATVPPHCVAQVVNQYEDVYVRLSNLSNIELTLYDDFVADQPVTVYFNDRPCEFIFELVGVMVKEKRGANG